MAKNIYVLYHAHCTDGTGSKYAAWKKFGKKAQYIAVAYGKPMPTLEPGSEIYIVDFSYPKEVLEALNAVHASVTVLDHHKTAEADLKDLPYCHFNMDKSGCVMAWEFFHPGEPVPDLLLDIQDRDLWLFKRPNSKAVHAGLALLDGDMTLWDRGARYSGDYVRVVNSGFTLLQRQDKAVKSAVDHKVKIISLFGHKCGIINANDLSSEIGSGINDCPKLAVDFALIYAITKDNTVLLSLRSKGDFDVSALAKNFGGGGHNNAAGGVTDLDTLMKILKEEM